MVVGSKIEIQDCSRLIRLVPVLQAIDDGGAGVMSAAALNSTTTITTGFTRGLTTEKSFLSRLHTSKSSQHYRTATVSKVGDSPNPRSQRRELFSWDHAWKSSCLKIQDPVPFTRLLAADACAAWWSEGSDSNKLNRSVLFMSLRRSECLCNAKPPHH